MGQRRARPLKAQKFILRELTTEFGGSAKAQATASEKLQVAWDNLFESFGKAFGPSLEKGHGGAGGLASRQVGEDPQQPEADRRAEVQQDRRHDLRGGQQGADRRRPTLRARPPRRWRGRSSTRSWVPRMWGKLAIGGAGGFLLKKLGLGGGISKLLAVRDDYGDARQAGVEGVRGSGVDAGAAVGGAGGAAAGGSAGGFAGLLAKGKVIAGGVGWAGARDDRRGADHVGDRAADQGQGTSVDRVTALEQVRKQTGGGQQLRGGLSSDLRASPPEP